jgi:hypothetical protein
MLTKSLENLAVPHEKNTVFISPELKRWSSLMAGNKSVLEELSGRGESRGELLRTARDYTRTVTNVVLSPDTVGNIIVTGHQPVWHHCGIWAKNLAVRRFAQAVGGHSLHLILDHDVCDTAMILPKRDRNDNWYAERLEIETEKEAVLLELTRPPAESRLRTFIDTIAEARSGSLCSDVWPQRTTWDTESMSYCKSVADIITRLQSALEVALGFDLMYLPVSRLSESNAFFAFATSIVTDAPGFAAAYNDSITSEISKQKATQRRSIRLSKLDNTADLIQLPFWLNTPDGKRTTLCVGAKIKIGNSALALGELDSASAEGKADQFRTMLSSAGYTMRPKAVSLTLFVRLYLADWFVHGIGSSLYEPVTDYIIRNYYGVHQLRFGTATCTMTLPLDSSTLASREDISQLKHTLHDIEHNPEKYMDESVLRQDNVASFLRAKTEAIILASNRSLSASVRKSAWHSLTKINRSLSDYTRETAATIEKKIADCERSMASREVCNCREYFFGLFPEDRLRKLADSLTFDEEA